MRFTYRAAGPIAVAAVSLLLCGCSRTQRDWRAAQQAGTPQAYKVFAERHPDSELAGVARQRMAQLTEEAAWQQATRANTPAAYQAYLTQYPNGSWSQDARIRMESRSLATEAQQSTGPVAAAAAQPAAAPGWSSSAASSPAPQTADPSAGARASAAVTPSGRSDATDRAAGMRAAASEAPSRRAVSAGGNTGRSAVQLGAFSSAANAHTAWRQLSSKFPPQLRGLTAQVVPVMSSGRRLYRLQARVPSQAAARRLCRQLQQHSQGCLPLP